MKNVPPSRLIFAGFALIGLAIAQYFTGIVPGRSRDVTAEGEPIVFGVFTALQFLMGVGCLIWGLAKLR